MAANPSGRHDPGFLAGVEDDFFRRMAQDANAREERKLVIAALMEQNPCVHRLPPEIYAEWVQANDSFIAGRLTESETAKIYYQLILRAFPTFGTA